MPEIQDIEDFKTNFAYLGNEAEIREQRGEELPDIEKPKKDSSDAESNDLSDLFDNEDEFSYDTEDDFSDDIDIDSESEEDTEDEFSYDTEDDFSEDTEDNFSLPDNLFEDTRNYNLDDNATEDELEDDNLEDVDNDFSDESFTEETIDKKEDEDEDEYEYDDIDKEALDNTENNEEETSSDNSDSENEEFYDPVEDDFLPEDSISGTNLDEIEDGPEEFSIDELKIEDMEEFEEDLQVSNEKEENNFESPKIDKNDDDDFDDVVSNDLETSDDKDEFKLKDSEFISIKKCLEQLPINLKLVIEELIGEKELEGEDLDQLLKALINGKNAKEIATITSKIVGRKISIPAQYERRSVEELEKQKNSFSYLFKKNFIPMFRVAALVASLIILLLYLGYNFVYRPIHAENLYRKGYNEILVDNNIGANNYFMQAFNEWKRKTWFFTYAEAFTDKKQYILAEEKYEQLLNVYPDDKQGILDYATLEYKFLGKYPQAEKLLKDYIFNNLTDYDTRLLLGDVYLSWADELDSKKYEDARFHYAKLLSQYGGKDELLFRMMRYFIRTNNYEETMKLYYGFRGNKKTKIDPEIYAELAGFLIDRSELRNVHEILMKAREIKEAIPEIHYQLARYFNMADIPNEEKKALLAAISLFESNKPLSKRQTGMLVDSYNLYGMRLYKEKTYIDAEKYFLKAATAYNEALATIQLKPKPKYGLIFSNLGDIEYYISGDYEQALDYFNIAEVNKYSTSELKYKKGLIYYTKKDYKNALDEFYISADGHSSNRALLYSTANTLFCRNDYYLAEGYYKELLDALEKEYFSIKYLLLDTVPSHRTLVQDLVKVYNNLAVTNYRLYERTQDPEKSAEAMVLLTDSMELYDTLARDPNTLERPETVNLAYLNSRAIFYPMPDYRLQIYRSIPKELERVDF